MGGAFRSFKGIFQPSARGGCCGNPERKFSWVGISRECKNDHKYVDSIGHFKVTKIQNTPVGEWKKFTIQYLTPSSYDARKLAMGIITDPVYVWKHSVGDVRLTKPTPVRQVRPSDWFYDLFTTRRQ